MNPFTMTTPETLRRKQALQAKLKELLRPTVPREELEIEYLPDPMDQTVSNTNRELALCAVDQTARLVQDVELALEAIADGAYGVCERCEQAIPARRLDAVPWARFCVACQSAEEAAGHIAEESPALIYAA